MSTEAFVTLATTDGYALGALVLAQSIRQVGTTRNLVVLISNHLSDLIRKTLETSFDEVIVVEELNSNDIEHLTLLSRPELGITFTKINCWLLEQYTKCVFLDSDCLVLKSIDQLFQREQLSAAPDAGWPDCFNSGVFVYQPSKQTFRQLVQFASQQSSSFDGGDQGLLNSFFSNWRTGDISRHLPFTYNVTANAFYSYLPAVTRFRNDIHIVHFAGALKPWQLTYNPQNQQLSGNLNGQNDIQRDFLVSWWNVMHQKVWPKIQLINQQNSNDQSFQQNQSSNGFDSSFNSNNLINYQGIQLGSAAHRRAWESGHIDYFGRDSFSNIQQQLEKNIQLNSYQYHPAYSSSSSSTTNNNNQQSTTQLKSALKQNNNQTSQISSSITNQQQQQQPVLTNQSNGSSLNQQQSTLPNQSNASSQKQQPTSSLPNQQQLTAANQSNASSQKQQSAVTNQSNASRDNQQQSSSFANQSNGSSQQTSTVTNQLNAPLQQKQQQQQQTSVVGNQSNAPLQKQQQTSAVTNQSNAPLQKQQQTSVVGNQSKTSFESSSNQLGNVLLNEQVLTQTSHETVVIQTTASSQIPTINQTTSSSSSQQQQNLLGKESILTDQLRKQSNVLNSQQQSQVNVTQTTKTQPTVTTVKQTVAQLNPSTENLKTSIASNENHTPLTNEHQSNWTVKSTIVTTYTQGAGELTGPTLVSKVVSEANATSSSDLPIKPSIKQISDSTNGNLSSKTLAKESNDNVNWLFKKVFIAITYTISLCYLLFLVAIGRKKNTNIISDTDATVRNVTTTTTTTNNNRLKK